MRRRSGECARRSARQAAHLGRLGHPSRWPPPGRFPLRGRLTLRLLLQTWSARCPQPPPAAAPRSCPVSVAQPDGLCLPFQTSWGDVHGERGRGPRRLRRRGPEGSAWCAGPATPRGRSRAGCPRRLPGAAAGGRRAPLPGTATGVGAGLLGRMPGARLTVRSHQVASRVQRTSCRAKAQAPLFLMNFQIAATTIPFDPAGAGTPAIPNQGAHARTHIVPLVPGQSTWKSALLLTRARAPRFLLSGSFSLSGLESGRTSGPTSAPTRGYEKPSGTRTPRRRQRDYPSSSSSAGAQDGVWEGTHDGDEAASSPPSEPAGALSPGRPPRSLQRFPQPRLGVLPACRPAPRRDASADLTPASCSSVAVRPPVPLVVLRCLIS